MLDQRTRAPARARTAPGRHCVVAVCLPVSSLQAAIPVFRTTGAVKVGAFGDEFIMNGILKILIRYTVKYPY